ncbi:MAG: glycosyl transferase [Sphingobacteriaceae bacterium]|nr:MAG: glycosyl transferase [Sphingobacteriaceae bacterium]
MKDNTKLVYIILFAIALMVNITGINVDFFTDDPGLYASIAKNMLYKNDFAQLFSYGQDWLDKPHFPFWMTYLSFKVFGVSAWAYRLPALLFFALALFYTFLFARKYYATHVAATAVLILLTAQYAFMGNVDVRAEPYLLALIIGSIYHISNLHDRFKITDLLLTALLTACAIMTKGIFVIVAIYGALFGQLMFHKKLKQLFSLKFIGLYLLTFVFVLPELYTLYIQFDLHPEKVVFERNNVSGIKWFLWDSQFGRFANSGPISRKSGDVFFYIHTLLWAFAPWCLLFYFALYKRIKNIVKKEPIAEYYTLSGGLLLLILFSLSGFQLPFYTNAVFPLFAIVLVPYCTMPLGGIEAKLRLISQGVYIVLLPVAVVVINYFLKPNSSLFFFLDYALFFGLVLLIVTQIKSIPQRIFLFSCTAALFTNLYLNTVLYKVVNYYNGQIKAAKYINKTLPSDTPVYSVKMQNNVFQFYCDRPVGYMPLEKLEDLNSSDALFYVNQASLDYLNQNKIRYTVVESFINYPQEQVLPDFVNHANRDKVLDKVYLIKK